MGELRTRKIGERRAMGRGFQDQTKGSAVCGTYLDPTLFLHLEGVFLGLGSIDGDSLARRCQLVSTADGWALPLLHLGVRRGWTGRGR
jgi:hypothetical protein